MRYKLSALFSVGLSLWAQAPNSTQRPLSNVQTEEVNGSPIFRVTVVQRTTQAVSYRNRSGWTKVDLQGTALAPEATGHADVNSRKGFIEVKADMHKLDPASKYGPEYLTYVLWAITPEGRSTNLGEVLLDDGTNGKLDVTTELQAFALIVTAEPYFGVTQPSDVVVMENIIRTDTLGKWETVNAKFDLLQRGQYTLNIAPGRLRPVVMNKKMPLELFEARNAVAIAQYANADKYAADVYAKAQDLLQQAENYQSRKNVGIKPVTMTAREAVQTAENARLLAVKRQIDEQLTMERQAASDREAKARADADESARQQAAAQAAERQAQESQRQAQEQQRIAQDQQRQEAARRQQAELDKMASDRARLEAEAATQTATQARAAAEAERLAAEQAKAAAIAEQQKLQLEAQRASADREAAVAAAGEANRLRDQAEKEKEQLRQQLLQQFNLILETRDTARGLIVNMSDVLFDTGKYTLRAAAREKLAKISGIILAHPGLKLDVEGHTDSVGGDEYNQRLSEQRAGAVRDYLTKEGLNGSSITATGFGKTKPVADNGTAAGRQQNRRVELVVSGEIIGTQIGGVRVQ